MIVLVGRIHLYSEINEMDCFYRAVIQKPAASFVTVVTLCGVGAEVTRREAQPHIETESPGQLPPNYKRAMMATTASYTAEQFSAIY
jgi:hypothetical protein